MGTGLLADGSKCHTCEGADAARADGKHVCVNCEGTGLTIPAAFDRKEIKAQDDEIERQLDEIGIAALADDIIRAAPEVAISTGSACSSVSSAPSHVLQAIGLSEPAIRSSLRIGVARTNDQDQIDRTIDILSGAIRKARQKA